MANPLINLLGGNNPAPQNNFMGLIQQFQQFKQNFKGDPKQRVQELLNSGKMSQEQFNQCENMARQLQNFLH